MKMSGWKHDGYRSKKTSRLTVPKNWITCPNVSYSTVIDKFVAFKTPLDKRYNHKVHFENRFNKEILFSSIDDMKVTLGLWIDLTNTNRYYNGFEIDGYVKIPCVGHFSPPSKIQARSFVNECKTFFAKNSLQCIGVHCTHGFNRTGFMIATYLIEVLNFDVISALAQFAAARPPGIYKQVLIDELYRRYSDEEPTLAPELPDWCIDI